MMIDRAWVKRNLGFDPIATPAPASTFSFARAQRTSSVEDLQREIIDFDSEATEGQAFLAFTTATGLSRFTDIPWPKALAPKADAKARKGPGGALPKADVLVVTWTVDEGHALSRVLTPGKDSRNDYVSYKHNFTRIAKKKGLVLRRDPGLFRRAQVVGIDRTVVVEHLGVTNRDGCPRRALCLQPAPANHVLSHVEYINAWLWLIHGNRLDLPTHTDRFVWLSDQRCSYV
jgi:hypothetical protein